jgi:hypothetical protein
VSDDKDPPLVTGANIAQPSSYPGNYLCVAFAVRKRRGYGPFAKGGDFRDGASRELTEVALAESRVADDFNRRRAERDLRRSPRPPKIGRVHNLNRMAAAPRPKCDGLALTSRGEVDVSMTRGESCFVVQAGAVRFKDNFHS